MEMLTRQLPQNLEAEQAVLGAILIESSAINQVMEILTADDFYKEAHRKIYNAMIDLDRDNKPIDLLTLFDYLKGNGNLLEEVGESSYLTYLTEIVPATENVSYYAKLVKEKSIIRNLVMAASDIAHQGNEGVFDIDEFIDNAEHKILDIAQNKIKPSFYDSRDLAARALEIIEQLHARKEMVTGIPTGFERLDYMTSGLQDADLVIVAARPGLGVARSTRRTHERRQGGLMNTDVLQGKWTQLKGQVRKQWGKLTGDDIDQVQGDAEILQGRIQERYGRTKEQAKEEIDNWLQNN